MLLKDEVLNEALEGLRNRIVSQLEDSAFGDRDTHHEAAISLQLLKNLRVMLRQFVDKGEAEQVRARNAAFERDMRQSIAKP